MNLGDNLEEIWFSSMCLHIWYICTVSDLHESHHYAQDVHI